MDNGTRAMWEAIDRSLPRLHALIGEMRTRGEMFTADHVEEIASDLVAARTEAAKFHAQPPMVVKT